MMKYDKLISELRSEICKNNCFDCVYMKIGCTPKMCEQAANAIEDLQKPKWIPVSERLPEENTKVLIVTERRNVIYGTFADGLFSDDWQYYTPDYVVWWMYIPKPPKEET